MLLSKYLESNIEKVPNSCARGGFLRLTEVFYNQFHLAAGVAMKAFGACDSFWSNTPSYYSLPFKGGGLYRRGVVTQSGMSITTMRPQRLLVFLIPRCPSSILSMVTAAFSSGGNVNFFIKSGQNPKIYVN